MAGGSGVSSPFPGRRGARHAPHHRLRRHPARPAVAALRPHGQGPALRVPAARRRPRLARLHRPRPVAPASHWRRGAYRRRLHRGRDRALSPARPRPPLLRDEPLGRHRVSPRARGRERRDREPVRAARDPLRAPRRHLPRAAPRLRARRGAGDHVLGPRRGVGPGRASLADARGLRWRARAPPAGAPVDAGARAHARDRVRAGGGARAPASHGLDAAPGARCPRGRAARPHGARRGALRPLGRDRARAEEPARERARARGPPRGGRRPWRGADRGAAPRGGADAGHRRRAPELLAAARGPRARPGGPRGPRARGAGAARGGRPRGRAATHAR